jgi:hypothetical protein
MYLLPRNFVLAVEYEIALEASHYHLPSGPCAASCTAVLYASC